MVINALGLNPFAPSACAPLWFVRNLFLLFMCSWILVYLVKLSYGVALALCLVSFSAYAWTSADGLFQNFLLYTFSFRGLTYFCIGLSLRYWDALNNRVASWAGLAIGICLVLMSETCLYKLGVLFVMYGTVHLSTSCQLPGFLTDNSFPMYVMHSLLIHFLKVIVGILSLSSFVASSLGCCMLLICIVMVALFAANMLRQAFPKLSYVVFGGR